MSKFLANLFRKNINSAWSNVRKRPVLRTTGAMVAGIGVPEIADMYSRGMGYGELSPLTRAMLGMAVGGGVLRSPASMATNLSIAGAHGLASSKVRSNLESQFGGNPMDPVFVQERGKQLLSDWADEVLNGMAGVVTSTGQVGPGGNSSSVASQITERMKKL